VVAGAHHVSEREQRRHERVVLADRQYDERPVCLRDAYRLALAAIDVAPAVAAAVQALTLQALLAEDAGSVRPQERRHTKSPRLTVSTSEPAASMTPMNSWPIRRPESVGSIDL
jgi:hypothetical protein